MKIRQIKFDNETDMAIIKTLSENPEVTRFLTWEIPDFNKPYFFFLVSTEEDNPVGWLEIYNVDVLNKKAELGLAFPEKQGLNLAYRAAKYLLRFAFCELKLNRVIFKILANNHKAIRGAIRNGFTLEGTERQGCKKETETFCDIEIYGLLKEEFKE